MKKIHQKLVRDNIPDIIISVPDVKVKIKILNDDTDYKTALGLKLTEETRELLEVLRNDPDNKKAIMDEVADIKEVVDAIIVAYGIEPLAAANFQIDKKLLKGGFEKRIYLEETESC